MDGSRSTCTRDSARWLGLYSKIAEVRWQFIGSALYVAIYRNGTTFTADRILTATAGGSLQTASDGGVTGGVQAFTLAATTSSNGMACFTIRQFDSYATATGYSYTAGYLSDPGENTGAVLAWTAAAVSDAAKWIVALA